FYCTSTKVGCAVLVLWHHQEVSARLSFQSWLVNPRQTFPMAMPIYSLLHKELIKLLWLQLGIWVSERMASYHGGYLLISSSSRMLL
ncbi:hypothetical protein P3X46_034475, partial [Hevea brasiliensis]